MSTLTLAAVTSPKDNQWSTSGKQLDCEEGGRLKWERTKEVKEVQWRKTGLLSGCTEFVGQGCEAIAVLLHWAKRRREDWRRTHSSRLLQRRHTVAHSFTAANSNWATWRNPSANNCLMTIGKWATESLLILYLAIVHSIIQIHCLNDRLNRFITVNFIDKQTRQRQRSLSLDVSSCKLIYRLVTKCGHLLPSPASPPQRHHLVSSFILPLPLD